MISESAYIETMKNCQKWNNKNVAARICSNQGVFDQQTGIEQKPTDHLHRSRLERCIPANPLQICSYPAKRYKRSKEFSSEACEFNHFRSTYPEINSTIMSITNPPIEFMHTESSEQSAMPLRSSTNNGAKPSNYEGFDESIDYDFDEIDIPSDNEDEWGSRKKRKKNGREGGGRSARRSAANNAAAAISSSTTSIVREQPVSSLIVASSSSEPRPFVCAQCGARYKSRPGLSYHRLHVHKDESIAQDFQKSPAAPLNILANAALSPGLDVSTTCDICQGSKELNLKTNQPENLVNCHDCGRGAHPSCVGFTPNMIISTKRWGWQCIECKSCTICGTSENDDALLFCDDCDRGFHLYCLRPPLKAAPEGNWSCQLCVKEFGQQPSTLQSK